MQSEYAASDRIFFRFENPLAQSSDFGGPSDFESKNGMASKFRMLSTTASSSGTIDELDGDTAG